MEIGEAAHGYLLSRPRQGDGFAVRVAGEQRQAEVVRIFLIDLSTRQVGTDEIGIGEGSVRADITISVRRCRNVLLVERIDGILLNYIFRYLVCQMAVGINGSAFLSKVLGIDRTGDAD